MNNTELIDHIATMSSIDNEAAMIAVGAAPHGIVSTLQGRDRISSLDVADAFPRVERRGRTATRKWEC